MMFHQSTNNARWLTRLRDTLFALLSILTLSLILPTYQVSADGEGDDDEGFCFAENGSTCTSANGGHLDANVYLGTYSGGNLDTDQLEFYFRAFDEDEGSSWKLWPQDVRYCGNSIEANCNGADSGVIGNEDGSGSNSNAYNQIAKVKVQNEHREPWIPSPGVSITGTTGDDNTRVPLKVLFSLKTEWLDQLLPGYHKVRVRISGMETEESESTSNLNIFIRFFIPDNVAISGLEPVNFGTFSESFNAQLTKTQTVCAHAQGAGGFKITASNDKGNYFLKGKDTGQRIKYKVEFGPKEDQLISLRYGLPSGSVNDGFIGHISPDCGNNENMWLGITLTESFESISTKPADTYSDKLTLTISPD